MRGVRSATTAPRDAELTADYASTREGGRASAAAAPGAPHPGPAHGYELKQALEKLLGAAYPQPNVGQIYVTLGRLEKAA